LASLHGVSGRVPFVFTEFDWKNTATKLNLATVNRRRQPPPTAAGQDNQVSVKGRNNFYFYLEQQEYLSEKARLSY